jgi:hypothetical protein
MADPKKKEQSNIKNFSDHHNTVMETLRRRPVPSSSITSRGKNGINDSQRKIVEHHFNFDKNHNLLPGLPKHDQDLARDIHDFFNLIILVPIIALNVLNWNWDKLFKKPISKFGIPFVDCWTGEYFNGFFFTCMAYFIIDLLWVVVIPRSVKIPMTIIKHHIATILYLQIPYFVPSTRFLFGVLMSVEINTWCLIARRVFNKQGFPPWTINLPFMVSIRVKLISICFYITWISIRCLLYPYVLLVFYKMATAKGGNYLNEKERMALAIGVCLHAVFCYLNACWTIDLIYQKIRQWKSKEKIISSGL